MHVYSICEGMDERPHIYYSIQLTWTDETTSRARQRSVVAAFWFVESINQSSVWAARAMASVMG